MSKPSKATRAEVIVVKVMIEQEWAYARYLEHYSYPDMRKLVSRPTHEGGLGYDLSQHALKGLVSGYLERMRDTLVVTPAETMARELADLDAQHRAYAALCDPIDRAASLVVARSVGYQTVDELLEYRPELVRLRDDKVIIAALSQMRAVGESRRKLLGTDAAGKLEVTINDDAKVYAELNEMLVRQGAKPIAVPTPER